MASTPFPLASAWLKIGAAGQNLIIQNLGGGPILVTTSAGLPPTLDGVRLMPQEKQAGILAADLYARSDFGGFVLVADGFFASTASSTSSSTIIPSNAIAPTIAGTAQVGQILTAAPGSWIGSPTTYAYQWKRNGAAITSATSATYSPALADIGATISVLVTASNAAGSASASSAATAAVTAAAAASTAAGTADFSQSGNSGLIAAIAA